MSKFLILEHITFVELAMKLLGFSFAVDTFIKRRSASIFAENIVGTGIQGCTGQTNLKIRKFT